MCIICVLSVGFLMDNLTSPCFWMFARLFVVANAFCGQSLTLLTVLLFTCSVPFLFWPLAVGKKLQLSCPFTWHLFVLFTSLHASIEHALTNERSKTFLYLIGWIIIQYIFVSLVLISIQNKRWFVFCQINILQLFFPLSVHFPPNGQHFMCSHAECFPFTNVPGFKTT